MWYILKYYKDLIWSNTSYILNMESQSYQKWQFTKKLSVNLLRAFSYLCRPIADWRLFFFLKKFYSVETVKPINSTEYFEYSAILSNIFEYDSVVGNYSREIKIFLCQKIKSAMQMEVSGNSISRHINNKCIYFGMSKK